MLDKVAHAGLKTPPGQMPPTDTSASLRVVAGPERRTQVASQFDGLEHEATVLILQEIQERLATELVPLIRAYPARVELPSSETDPTIDFKALADRFSQALVRELCVRRGIISSVETGNVSFGAGVSIGSGVRINETELILDRSGCIRPECTELKIPNGSGGEAILHLDRTNIDKDFATYATVRAREAIDNNLSKLAQEISRLRKIIDDAKYGKATSMPHGFELEVSPKDGGGVGLKFSRNFSAFAIECSSDDAFIASTALKLLAMVESGRSNDLRTLRNAITFCLDDSPTGSPAVDGIKFTNLLVRPIGGADARADLVARILAGEKVKVILDCGAPAGIQCEIEVDQRGWTGEAIVTAKNGVKVTFRPSSYRVNQHDRKFSDLFDSQRGLFSPTSGFIKALDDGSVTVDGALAKSANIDITSLERVTLRGTVVVCPSSSGTAIKDVKVLEGQTNLAEPALSVELQHLDPSAIVGISGFDGGNLATALRIAHFLRSESDRTIRITNCNLAGSQIELPGQGLRVNLESPIRKGSRGSDLFRLFDLGGVSARGLKRVKSGIFTGYESFERAPSR